MMGKGVDATGLGKWCWTKYQGKGGKVLRVITAYRACHIGCVKSTVPQQFRYLIKKNRAIYPMKAFLDDLQSEISIWRETGESIVVMGDFNETLNPLI